MAAKDERFSAKANRDDYDAIAKKLGHDLEWKLAPNANRKGHCYYLVGTCRNCAADLHVGAMWSSSSSIVIDARHDTCSGPGTSILTEIEQGRVRELMTEAVANFGAEFRSAIARMN